MKWHKYIGQGRGLQHGRSSLILPSHPFKRSLTGRLVLLAPGRNPAPLFSISVAYKGPLSRFDTSSLEIFSFKFRNVNQRVGI